MIVSFRVYVFMCSGLKETGSNNIGWGGGVLGCDPEPEALNPETHSLNATKP